MRFGLARYAVVSAVGDGNSYFITFQSLIKHFSVAKRLFKKLSASVCRVCQIFLLSCVVIRPSFNVFRPYISLGYGRLRFYRQ